MGIALLFYLFTPLLFADYTDEEILWAIFKAEGGYKAKYYFGIRSVKYKDFEDAKRICLNTIRNNRKRFLEQNQYKDFIEFLGSRYAPIGAENDPKNLNKNWVKNVRYFLEKNKK